MFIPNRLSQKEISDTNIFSLHNPPLDRFTVNLSHELPLTTEPSELLT